MSEDTTTRASDWETVRALAEDVADALTPPVIEGREALAACDRLEQEVAELREERDSLVSNIESCKDYGARAEAERDALATALGETRATLTTPAVGVVNAALRIIDGALANLTPKETP